MSREIKFRAWDIKNKRFVNIVRLVFDQFGSLDYADVVYKGKIYKLYPSEVVLEQDTGLKDTNGKEIYEGDIVTLCGEWEDIENDDCQVVTFSDGCFRVGDGYENEAGSYLQDWRDIGNIHENPELLEKGAKND